MSLQTCSDSNSEHADWIVEGVELCWSLAYVARHWHHLIISARWPGIED